MEIGEDSGDTNFPEGIHLSNGSLEGHSEPRFVVPADYDEKFAGVEAIPNDSTVQMKRIRYAEQQQNTVELSLEGLQSSGHSTMTEEEHSCLQRGTGYNIPSGALMSQDMAPGVTSTSEDLTDERLAQHGVPDGLFEIAPLKLQVTETTAPCPAVEAALRQGRQPFEVVLRGGTPWGFALNGGKSTGLPVYISKVG